MAAAPGPTPHSAARLAPGFQLGDYRVGAPLWPLRIADGYRAEGPRGPAIVYVVHARIAQHVGVRDEIIAGTRAAAAMPPHESVVHTIAAGLTGDILWIATEDAEGTLARELFSKKRLAGGSVGPRAASSLVAGACAALADARHGALADESVLVERSGRVRIADLALGRGTLAAIRAGLIPASSALPPESLAGAAPSGPGDVFGIGALLYEALVGRPLERGGPRPSDVVDGLDPQVDDIVARACHPHADKRFARADVLGPAAAEALGKSDVAPAVDHVPVPLPMSSGAMAADAAEKWLISQGKFDYGPFSLGDVIAQIEKGEIVAGAVIVDKDSGARNDVATHPLLGPMIEAARQKRDDARRAQAEVKAQSSEKKRGATLYAVIGLGVVGAAVAVYFIINAVKHEESSKVAGLSALEQASLNVKVSEPKPPPKPQHKATTGAHHGSTGANPANTGENLALDLSDESDDGGEQLDMHTVFGVYSKYGGQLGGCLQQSGESSANIGIIINGPSGRVTWVKVNGKQAGGLYSCLSRVLRGMQFPTIHGPRTRAEFDIAM